MAERNAPTIFAAHFDFPPGWSNDRCEKPSGQLTPHKHWEMTLPLDLGRAALDSYFIAGVGVYSRLVSHRTGEVAWFRVSKSAGGVPAGDARDPEETTDG